MTYSLLSMRPTKAIKPHMCIWCSREILVGSRYSRETSTYDGHFQDFAWHEACRNDADEYFADGGCESFTSENEMPFQALYELEASHV